MAGGTISSSGTCATGGTGGADGGALLPIPTNLSPYDSALFRRIQMYLPNAALQHDYLHHHHLHYEHHGNQFAAGSHLQGLRSLGGGPAAVATDMSVSEIAWLTQASDKDVLRVVKQVPYLSIVKRIYK